MVQNSVSSYAALKKRVHETLLLGQRRIEQEKLKTYWQTGKLIYDHVLQHKDRAGYSEEVIQRLSKDLDVSERSLYETVQFARAFPNLRPGAKLTFSHYRRLASVADPKLRTDLAAQAERHAWSSHELITRISKAAAVKSIANQKFPILTPPHIGPFWTYQILDSDTIHAMGKDTLWVDLGFRTFLEAERFEAGKIKAGDVAISTKDKDNVYTLSRQEPADPDSLFTYKAYVERLIDGDTIKAQIDLGFDVWTRQTLRLRGIDAFEIDTKTGRRAKEFVERALKNESFVTIKTTRSDKYDRFLADIFYGANEYLNQRLLDEKLAVKV
jgi:endonuclease YncB( thermonuclease family)